MNIQQVINFVGVEDTLARTFRKIHEQGPIDPPDFEFLAYLKHFHQEFFTEYERKLIAMLGLFFKTSKPKSVISEIYGILSDVIEEGFGVRFTPVQADARSRISDNVYFSFSAPTSAGKSYLFRDLIKKAHQDIVIVVPTRALISEYVHALNKIVDKDVLVHQFIEVVNKRHIKRRVYVITPERGGEVFKHLQSLNIGLVLFDEAQISEVFIRGLKFDSFVRRIDKALPQAKKVFAHPFIINPEAQLSKHNFIQNSAYYSYKQHTVGKIYAAEKNGKFRYFSPFETGKTVFVDTKTDLVENTLKNKGTVLVYSSKAKIYDATFLIEFEKYVALCKPVTASKALTLIEDLRLFIGASKQGMVKHSHLIEMMEKGIVLHHGSIPLKGRLIIEEFVNENFAQMCFSTSTLIQGINMPFDLVWVDNFHFKAATENDKTLELKNLIGRAGRTSPKIDSFDYGYVIVPNKNIDLFRKRMLQQPSIKATSQLDEKETNIEVDAVDIVEAMQNNTFNDEYHLTETQVKRLESSDMDANILFILDNLLLNGRAIKGSEYYLLKGSLRKKVKLAFQQIFLAHLRRKEITLAEKTILSASIPIMLWQIQGKSFAEIVSLRYAYLTQLSERRAIARRLKAGEITVSEATRLLSEISIKRSPIASELPNKNVQAPSLFPVVHYKKLDYDTLVYDTYDYLDKVIGLSLVDPLYAAFSMYHEKTKDERALTMANYIKYGTNDDKEIWLLKYGFSFEDVEWIRDYVTEINDQEIVFDDAISEISPKQREVISRFIN